MRTRNRQDQWEPPYYTVRPFWQDLLITVLPVLCDQAIGLVRDIRHHRHEIQLQREAAELAETLTEENQLEASGEEEPEEE